MKKTISDYLDENDIKEWTSEEFIIINSQTGTGKSYFVRNTLYEYFKKNNLRCLYLVPRGRLKEEFREEFKNDKYITFETYQWLEYNISNEKNSASNFDFIVADECHYFTNDSDFNNRTDISFAWILEQNTSIKIFISATVDSFTYLISHYNVPLKNVIPEFLKNYRYIRKLKFFYDDEFLINFAKNIIGTEEKVIIFTHNKDMLNKIYKLSPDNVLFVCSKQSKQSYRKYMDSSKVKELLKTHRFNENILLATAAIDAGITLKDEKINRVIIDIFYPETVIQCLGRKRIISENDKIDLYIRKYNNQQINGKLRAYEKKLADAKKLIENENKYHQINERQNDPSGFVVNVKDSINVDNEILYKKDFNWTKLKNIEYQATVLFPRLLKDKHGYCKYLARYLDFYNEVTGEYTYNVISTEEKDLRDFLDSIVGVELLSKERKPLIEKIGVKDGRGRLLKSIDTLNGVLKEYDLPHRIMEYKTTIRIDGNRKKRVVWKVINPETVNPILINDENYMWAN